MNICIKSSVARSLIIDIAIYSKDLKLHAVAMLYIAMDIKGTKSLKICIVS